MTQSDESNSKRPAYIGLCPDPAHMDEFYMPLDEPRGKCPHDCPHDLIVYVPLDGSDTEWLDPKATGKGMAMTERIEAARAAIARSDRAGANAEELRELRTAMRAMLQELEHQAKKAH